MQRAPSPVGTRAESTPSVGRIAADTRSLGVRRATRIPQLDLIVLTLFAFALWMLSLHQIHLRQMGELGLVSVLPISAFLALFILTASFSLCVRDPRSPPIFFLHIVVLLVMLYGITALVEDVARLGITWRNIGIADYIQRTGTIDLQIDSYFNWPGFFTVSAFVGDLTGIRDLGPLAAWAPVFFNLLYLVPLLMVFRAATTDQRLVWASVWIFYLANWMQQDYFSPEALAYVLYLAFIAILLRWFTVGPPASSGVPASWNRAQSADSASTEAEAAPATPLTPAKRLVLTAVLIAVFAAMVPTHPLTALAALACATLLAAFRRSFAVYLPVIMLAVIGAWLTFFLITQGGDEVSTLLRHIGQLGGAADAGERLNGGAEHGVGVTIRLVVTSLLWALAALGAARAFQSGRRYYVYGVLALAAFTLFLLEPYVGDIVADVYRLTLPFVALFIASLFYPARAIVYTRKDVLRSWQTSRFIVVTSLALVIAFFFIHFGNEKMDYFTRGDLDATRRLYAVAPHGSLLIAGVENLPWKFRDYEQYDYALVVRTRHWDSRRITRHRLAAVVRDVENLMRQRGRHRAYLIITRSQKAAVNVSGAGPRGSLDRLEARMLASGSFRVVYRNRDAKIFTLKREKGSATV